MNYNLKAYKLINLIFAGIVIGIFIYSGIFNPEKANYPIHSFYSTLTGEESISTGLSRSFSSIMRLNFSKAYEYNEYGISLFVFFLLQLFLRIFHYWFSGKELIKLSNHIFVDCIISGGLFIYFFLPFIKELLNA